MKPGTTLKLKFIELKSILGIPKWQAVGILESLWDFASENCPDGDIGRYTPTQIALAIEYQGDADFLIDSLINTRWLDRNADNKIWIHNWAIHRAHFVTERAELRYLRNIPIPCGFCGNDFHPTHERSKFCSPACRQSNHRKKNQQITQCNAKRNAVTQITQSNANVTHSPVPVPVPVPKKTPPFPPNGEMSKEFDIFWTAYPKKVAKEDTKKVWKKLNPDTSLQKRILEAIQIQCKTEGWKKENGQYIPAPDKWLRGSRWEDSGVQFEIIKNSQPVPLNRYTRFAADRQERINAKDWDFDPENNPGEKQYQEYKAQGLCE